MVITLNNGKTVTVYEKQNILPQIRDYIDNEVYELLKEKMLDIEEDLGLEKEDLQESLDNAEVHIDILELQNERLRDRYTDLCKNFKRSEQQKNEILSEIQEIFKQSCNNKLSIDEVENKLKELYIKY
jgi:chromosome segregation ATPase